ncbi:MOSC domain-containing protein [Aneurinibacillus sp. Ricciae_BoGa-3]|uniref:MOSC domain-containing protein n=1 Tax=Aneurinibacillus sp. Ricciae_BoGa-3 TaxID=3022697 RepID=UPI0023418180|nr:MOSC domain-containing protein [Aneurinibacillus sp. Ricciae_BoGa-3]WCK52714.1 MOSC domain-containing protein [Aneurinibacillus sp. Ricciae_BoGa-3]
MVRPSIISVNIGMPKVIRYADREVSTAIFKERVDTGALLTRTGFLGDKQGDLKNHGGLDKAACVHAFEHYPYWQEELKLKLAPGAFGENLTIAGMPEEAVCIGDLYQIGEAVVQVSQPRQPCYKINIRLDAQNMPARIEEHGSTGYYLRVIEEGKIMNSDVPALLKRDPLGVSVAYVNRITHHEKDNTQGIERILSVEALSDSWRDRLAARLKDRPL